MIRTQRTVTLALLALIGVFLGGCSNGTVLDPAVRSTVVNTTDQTLRVSLHAGDRVRLEGRPAQPIHDGRAVEIARGQSDTVSVRRPRTALVVTHKPDSSLVYWVRAEIITPSWDQEAVFWFEILGPPAEIISIGKNPAADTSSLQANSATAPITRLETRYYPMRDRNYAFETGASDTTAAEPTTEPVIP